MRSWWYLLAVLVAVTVSACREEQPPRAEDWKSGPIEFDWIESINDEECAVSSSASPLEWSKDFPGRPEEVLIILDPGHGPGNARVKQHKCVDVDGANKDIASVAKNYGLNIDYIQEDELTLMLARRLAAALSAAEFNVGLTRTVGYNPGGPAMPWCVTQSLFELSPQYPPASCNTKKELNLRGHNEQYSNKEISKYCLGDSRCISDVALPNGKSISRAGQIVRRYASRLGIAYDPVGDNAVDTPRVAYLSIHFNALDSAGDDRATMGLMFAGTLRGLPSGFSRNPALTFSGGGPLPIAYVEKNYATSLMEYMFAKLRLSTALPEAAGKQWVKYWNLDLSHSFANYRPASGIQQGLLTNDGRKGPLQTVQGVEARVAAPPGGARPLTAVSGFEERYTNGRLNGRITLKKEIIRIANSALVEVAQYNDCRNVGPLLLSLNREGNPPFDPDASPLDMSDSLDAATDGIFRGIVEFYESYNPGFKAAVCANLASGGGGYVPDWCSSSP